MSVLSERYRTYPSRILREAGIVVILAVMVLLRALPASGSDEPMSPEEFTKHISQEIVLRSPAAVIDYMGPLELDFKSELGVGFRLNLQNAYREYLSAPESAAHIVDRWTSEFLAMGGPLSELTKADVLPIIKTRDWLDRATAQPDSPPGEEPTWDALNDELIVVYARETATTINYLPKRELDRLGLVGAELRTVAIANLRRLLPKIQIGDGGALKIIAAGGIYEDSILLLDEFWERWVFPMKGEITVAIPARGIMAVTGSEDTKGLAIMRSRVEKLWRENPNSLSKNLFVRRNGSWVRFAP